MKYKVNKSYIEENINSIKYQIITQIQKNHPLPIDAAGILGPDLVTGIFTNFVSKFKQDYHR